MNIHKFVYPGTVRTAPASPLPPSPASPSLSCLRSFHPSFLSFPTPPFFSLSFPFTSPQSTVGEAVTLKESLKCYMCQTTSRPAPC